MKSFVMLGFYCLTWASLCLTWASLCLMWASPLTEVGFAFELRGLPRVRGGGAESSYGVPFLLTHALNDVIYTGNRRGINQSINGNGTFSRPDQSVTSSKYDVITY